jgi:hypothetical protein
MRAFKVRWQDPDAADTTAYKISAVMYGQPTADKRKEMLEAVGYTGVEVYEVHPLTGKEI